jgi:hypothetical protein
MFTNCGPSLPARRPLDQDPLGSVLVDVASEYVNIGNRPGDLDAHAVYSRDTVPPNSVLPNADIRRGLICGKVFYHGDPVAAVVFNNIIKETYGVTGAEDEHPAAEAVLAIVRDC